VVKPECGKIDGEAKRVAIEPLLSMGGGGWDAEMHEGGIECSAASPTPAQLTPFPADNVL
jgi:hypothetical protein